MWYTSTWILTLFPLCSFAYIEFSDRDSVTSAIGLHETLFRGRVLKVSFVVQQYKLELVVQY